MLRSDIFSENIFTLRKLESTCVPVNTSGRIAVEMLEELEDDIAADGVADEGELAVGRHVLLDEGDLVADLA